MSAVRGADGGAAPAAVDVLIPVFNGARTVERAVRSIMAQTLADLHIVVVDDGSTDETPAILARLAGDDPRIEVVTQPNGGIVEALNAGLRRCRGEYVARHDADDIAFPHRLATQRAFLDAHPAYVAIGCNAFHIDADDRRTGYTTEFHGEPASDFTSAPSVEPYVMHPFLFARRDALVAVGGYRHAFHSEDTDLYWRLTDVGRLFNLDDVLGEYRLHADSVSARSIVNGRVAAVDSQRAAVSARRRRSGGTDLTFDRRTLAAYTAAATLDGILGVASIGLSADEKAYLEIATVAKLLELSSYRPYRLDAADLATMRRAIETHWHRLTPFNRRQVVFRGALDRRRWTRDRREVRALVPWKIMPAAVAELVAFVVRKRLGGRG